ncbi:hypothetical protein GCM10010191_73940 [Actinomadura vinacea]|uniref:HEAT repeat domain-containing protein n=1 Tax=Actinomadura vinacea TaxID=115336 RepID=A0ABP5XC41_9ACTN
MSESTRRPVTEEITRAAEEHFRRAEHADPEALARRLVQALGDGRMRDLARAPALLSMLCELFASAPGTPVPTSKAALFLRFVSHRCARLPLGSELLLEEIAHRLRDEKATLPVETAAEVRNAEQVLDPSGLFVREGDGLRFADPAIHEFLVARYIEHGQPIGAYSSWRYLRPRHGWSDRRLQVALFVAGLRLENGESLGLPLRLLVRRRRDRVTALSFVAALAGDGAPLPDAIVARTGELLEGMVVRVQDPRDWRRTVDALELLDGERALAALETAVRSSPEHELRAAELLLERDPRRAERAMAAQTGDTGVPAARRERMIALLSEHLPPDKATELLVERALDPSLDAAAVKLALTVLPRDRLRGLALLEHQLAGAAWRDEVRLSAGVELLRQDGTRALPGLETLGLATSVSPEVRLQAGQALVEHEAFGEHGTRVLTGLARDGRVPHAAVRVEAAVRIPTRVDGDACLAFMVSRAGGLDEAGRLDAATALLGRDRALGLAALDELLDDRRVSRESWLRAALVAAPADRGFRLERLSRSKRMGTDEQVRAAKALVRFDRPVGGRRLGDLAVSARGLSDAERLRTAVAALEAAPDCGKEALVRLTDGVLDDPHQVLEAIGHLSGVDPGLADQRLARLAGPRGWTGPEALWAASAIGSERRRLAALAELADRDLDLGVRLAAIDEVARASRREAARLYRRLLDTGRLDHAEQLAAAVHFQDHDAYAAKGYIERLAADPDVAEPLRETARSRLA